MQVVLAYLKRRLKCVLQPRIPKQKSPKTLILGYKVVDLDVNLYGVWDFLLLINTVVTEALSRTASEIRRLFGSKSPFFVLTISALDRRDTFQISWKAWRILKLQSS